MKFRSIFLLTLMICFSAQAGNETDKYPNAYDAAQSVKAALEELVTDHEEQMNGAMAVVGEQEEEVKALKAENDAMAMEMDEGADTMEEALRRIRQLEREKRALSVELGRWQGAYGFLGAPMGSQFPGN